jgi:hypothetical protein
MEKMEALPRSNVVAKTTKARYLCPFQMGKFTITSWICEDGNDVTMTSEYLCVDITHHSIKVQILSENIEFDIAVGQRLEIRDGHLTTSLLD